jgi:hypothetical protein
MKPSIIDRPYIHSTPAPSPVKFTTYNRKYRLEINPIPKSGALSTPQHQGPEFQNAHSVQDEKGLNMNKNYGVASAREYLLEGHPLTRIETLLLFGVPDLTKIISGLRAEHYIICRTQVSFAAAIVRMRGFADVVPPANLPVTEILLTEYRISQ